MTQTGVYLGTDPTKLSTYTQWAGAAPANVLNFLNNDSWSGLDSSAGWQAWQWKGAGPGNVWAMPLTVHGTSLEQVATGAYNGHFLTAAQALAQSQPSNDGSIYVRVGWEFNGDWMPWAAQGHEDAFINAFHQLVDTFRSVSDKFKFVWDVTEGDSTYNPAKAYPGDHYVDVIGMDTYYNTAWDSTDPTAAFQHNVKEPYGLQWQQDFAAAHGKATAFSEWGVQSDNAGPYIQAMSKWMSDHHMVYANYWNSSEGGYNGTLSNGQYPHAADAFRESFASSPVSSAASVSSGPVTAALTQNDTVVVHASSASSQGEPQVVAPISGSDTLVVRVSADSWQGDPHFVVSVDGQQVGGTLSTSASHAAGQTQDITLTGPFGPGAHDVAVTFLDDAWGGSDATDRNLYVHQVSLNGHSVAGDNASNTAGPISNGVADLLGHGSASFYADWHI